MTKENYKSIYGIIAQEVHITNLENSNIQDLFFFAVKNTRKMEICFLAVNKKYKNIIKNFQYKDNIDPFIDQNIMFLIEDLQEIVLEIPYVGRVKTYKTISLTYNDGRTPKRIEFPDPTPEKEKTIKTVGKIIKSQGFMNNNTKCYNVPFKNIDEENYTLTIPNDIMLHSGKAIFTNEFVEIEGTLKNENTIHVHSMIALDKKDIKDIKKTKEPIKPEKPEISKDNLEKIILDILKTNICKNTNIFPENLLEIAKKEHTITTEDFIACLTDLEQNNQIVFSDNKKISIPTPEQNSEILKETTLSPRLNIQSIEDNNDKNKTIIQSIEEILKTLNMIEGLMKPLEEQKKQLLLLLDQEKLKTNK